MECSLPDAFINSPLSFIHANKPTIVDIVAPSTGTCVIDSSASTCLGVVLTIAVTDLVDEEGCTMEITFDCSTDSPTVATPTPITPSPVSPAPITPAPVATPSPVTPSPVSPAPITPAPVGTPAPTDPQTALSCDDDVISADYNGVDVLITVDILFDGDFEISVANDVDGDCSALELDLFDDTGAEIATTAADELSFLAALQTGAYQLAARGSVIDDDCELQVSMECSLPDAFINSPLSFIHANKPTIVDIVAPSTGTCVIDSSASTCLGVVLTIDDADDVDITDGRIEADLVAGDDYTVTVTDSVDEEGCTMEITFDCSTDSPTV